MKSGLIDERIGTRGSGLASGAAAAPLSPASAPCTLEIGCGRSLTDTLLLLTCAATMSAVSVISVSSFWLSMIFVPSDEIGKARRTTGRVLYRLAIAHAG